ncbi:brassinosteroid-responsive RING protein 1-like [Humulus lupulus]|uniref:brassinosteroid-responsive RING protein 1-like n=1 Tax=Humulus lupulus TaxID=3486 RepID=UPI002B404A91|nr:brassinosteroid-responsive RING protein 1-like [Humulus lupulus]
MGFTCLIDLHMITSQDKNFSVVSYLKHIFIAILSHLLIIDHPQPSDGEYDREEYSSPPPPPPPPSMALFPDLFLAESIKRQLPAMPYRRFLQLTQQKHDHEEDEDECTICMDTIEFDDEIRAPMNCCHVFHKKCLDGWVDQGQPSCPLCRSKLVSTSSSSPKDHRDPWRSERMVYLFGEDDYF